MDTDGRRAESAEKPHQPVFQRSIDTDPNGIPSKIEAISKSYPFTKRTETGIVDQICSATAYLIWRAFEPNSQQRSFP